MALRKSLRDSVRLLGFLIVGFAPTAAGAEVASAKSLPSPVDGYPIGWCIRAKPEMFADAKAAGFEHVELALQDVLPLTDDEFRVLVAQLRASGLRALSGYNSVPKEIMIVGPTADIPQQEAHLRRLIERAATLKLTYLILNAGPSWRVPEGGSRDAALAQLTDFGRRFAALTARHGITVLLPTVRNTDSNLITTIAEAVALVEAVNHPNFMLMVDYSFLRIQRDDLNALRRARGHLKNVHIANPEKNRTYPMDDTESDYPSFFRLLKEIGYRGGVSVHAGTQNFAADAPRAITFLRTKVRELSGPK